MDRRERLKALIRRLPEDKAEILECYIVARYPEAAAAAGFPTEGPALTHEEARALVLDRFGYDVGPQGPEDRGRVP